VTGAFRMANPTPPAELETAAEAILHTLAVQGVDFVFFHPGTDTAPLQEAVFSLGAKRLACPTILPCAYESVGLAAAHGYWKVTQRPQAVVVHVDIGTQNLGAMLHDAQRDHAGVVIIAGKAPYTADSVTPGARSNYIHWQQDEPDQLGLVRGYVKWALELPRADVAVRAVSRAMQAAKAEPSGPTYLMVAREVLMEDPGVLGVDIPTGYPVPGPPAVPPDALVRATEALAGASRPVVITSRLGRRPEAVPALQEFAELIGAYVFGRPESLNLPWEHPLYLRDATASQRALETADVVLVLDCVVPWIPSQGRPGKDAIVIQIDADPVKLDMPMWTFPVQLPILAGAELALRQLVESLSALAAKDPSLAAAWAERSERLMAEGRVFPRVRNSSTKHGGGPATPTDVMEALNIVIRSEDIVVDETVTSRSALHQSLRRSLPGTLYSSGGPGLGWALGASVGIKLAAPERRVIALVGDGTFIFGHPIAALMLAQEAETPFLTVVLNNREYRASKLPVFALFPTGYSADRGEAVATRFRAAPNFALVAEACGSYGEIALCRDDLVPALRRCLDALSEGRCAVLDVTIQTE
jgi:acetolactate synthase-1/2/3 large subunit